MISTSPSFNAQVRHAGLRGRILLDLGLPLWEVLPPDGQVALIAHELGHLANDDPRNGRIVETALLTLHRWADILRPTFSVRQPTVYERAICSGLLAVVHNWYKLIVRISLPNQRRAEVASDQQAVRVAGSTGVLSLLTSLLLGSRVGAAMAHAARYDEDPDLFVVARSSASSAPTQELERLERIAQRVPFDIWATHPPLRMRRAVVEAMGTTDATITLDPDAHQRISQELAAERAEQAKQLRELARNH
jgi:Zn-dependent protease with chaperone function